MISFVLAASSCKKSNEEEKSNSTESSPTCSYLDERAPSIVNLSPANGSVDVSNDLNRIIVTFNQTMNSTAYFAGNCITYPMDFDSSWNDEKTEFTINFLSNLDKKECVFVLTKFTSSDGYDLIPFVYFFTVENDLTNDITVPEVLSYSPSIGNVVSVSTSEFNISFSDAFINNSTVIVKEDSNSSCSHGIDDFSYEWDKSTNTFVFKPKSELLPSLCRFSIQFTKVEVNYTTEEAFISLLTAVPLCFSVQ